MTGRWADCETPLLMFFTVKQSTDHGSPLFCCRKSLLLPDDHWAVAESMELRRSSKRKSSTVVKPKKKHLAFRKICLAYFMTMLRFSCPNPMPYVVKQIGTEARLQTKMASTAQGLGKETEGHTWGTFQANLFSKEFSQ